MAISSTALDDSKRTRVTVRAAASRKSIGGMRRRLLVWTGRLAILAAICAIWQYASAVGWVDPVFVGRPSEIAKDFVAAIEGPVLFVDAYATVINTLIGFALATVAGMLVAVLLAEVRIVDEMVQPFLTAMNSMPRVALAPLFVMWFGIGGASKIALSASLVFFIVLLNTMAGIQRVDDDHIVLANSLGATPMRRFLKITLPSAIPSIFAGIELGMVYGFLGTVAGEMLAGENGIGVRLQQYSGLFETNKFFAALLLLVIVTTTISAILRLIRRRLLHWQDVGLGRKTKAG
jgi:NitT/TauT family transport system permease protein